MNNPLSLEMNGYALFDMYVERRGDIFTDEVRFIFDGIVLLNDTLYYLYH